MWKNGQLEGAFNCVQRSILLLLLENQHLIVSLVANHTRKYIFYSCYPFIYLLDCSRLFLLWLWFPTHLVLGYEIHMIVRPNFILATIYLSQIDNCPSLKSFSLHIASINHNRKAGLRVKNYKSIIVMMQINPNCLLKLSGVYRFM